MQQCRDQKAWLRCEEIVYNYFAQDYALVTRKEKTFDAVQWLSELLPWSPGEIEARETYEKALNSKKPFGRLKKILKDLQRSSRDLQRSLLEVQNAAFWPLERTFLVAFYQFLKMFLLRQLLPKWRTAPVGPNDDVNLRRRFRALVAAAGGALSTVSATK